MTGLTRLCTLLGALVLARATRGSPLSEEILTTRAAPAAGGDARNQDLRRSSSAPAAPLTENSPRPTPTPATMAV